MGEKKRKYPDVGYDRDNDRVEDIIENFVKESD
jgi:hypothetical protein